jgi:hypothetical protein
MEVSFIDLAPQCVVTFSGIRDVKSEIVKFSENCKERKQISTHMAALSSRLFYLKDTDLTSFMVFT